MLRRLVRHWIALAVNCQLLLLASWTEAAVIRVEGACTLVDAIIAANAGIASGDCPAGSLGRDEIVLTEHVTLTSWYSDDFGGSTGLPDITSNIVIQGGGFIVSRSASAPGFRLFRVNPTGELTLKDLTLFGGLQNVGGAIKNGGTTYLVDSFVFLNSSNLGGGIYNQGGLLILERSEVVSNTATWDGGGIYIQGGELSISNSSLRNNTAEHSGGAVYNRRRAYFSQTEFVSNAAADGGGVFNTSSGEVDILRSLLYDNQATWEGGGVQNDGGDVAILASTLSGNVALETGGGLYSDGYTYIGFSTFSGNEADPYSPSSAGAIHAWGTGQIKSIIVANGVGQDCSVSGPYIAGANFGCTWDPVTGLDPTLRDNGGPTRTHALDDSSNARDAHFQDNCPYADQRGIEKTNPCSSGAYEVGLCDDAVLRDQSVGTWEAHTACELFWLGPNARVLGPSGDLVVTAGHQIIFRDSFSVRQGGEMTAIIDPGLVP